MTLKHPFVGIRVAWKDSASRVLVPVKIGTCAVVARLAYSNPRTAASGLFSQAGEPNEQIVAVHREEIYDRVQAQKAQQSE